MKIDNDKFFVLDEERVRAHFNECMSDREHIEFAFDILEDSRHCVQYIANPVVEHIKENIGNVFNKKNIEEFIKDVDFDNNELCGTLLFKYKGFFQGVKYRVGMDEGEIFIAFIVSVTSKDVEDKMPSLTVLSMDNNLSIKANRCDDNIFKFACEVAVMVIAIEIFLRFAEIETKHVKVKTQGVLSTNCVYNKTSSDITMVDSTWYTNLIVSGAFKVRGHFRIYRERKSDGPRMVWIKDYEKHGYTRKAKLNNNQHEKEKS